MEKFNSIVRMLVTVLTTLLGIGYFQAPIEYTLAILNYVIENTSAIEGAVKLIWVVLGTAYSLFFDPKRSVNLLMLSTKRWSDRKVGYNISRSNPSQYKSLSL